MKRTLIASVAALAALGAAAYAQTPAPQTPSAPGDRPRFEERMERRGERMEERMNRRLDRLKGELRLSPQQETLWAPVETQLRQAQRERREYLRGNWQRMRDADLPDRMDLMAERMARGATTVRELANAVKPLWATLSDEQKQIVRRALPRGGMGMGPGMGPGRGDGRGPGWGPGERRG